MRAKPHFRFGSAARRNGWPSCHITALGQTYTKSGHLPPRAAPHPASAATAPSRDRSRRGCHNMACCLLPGTRLALTAATPDRPRHTTRTGRASIPSRSNRCVSMSRRALHSKIPAAPATNRPERPHRARMSCCPPGGHATHSALKVMLNPPFTTPATIDRPRTAHAGHRCSQPSTAPPPDRPPLPSARPHWIIARHPPAPSRHQEEDQVHPLTTSQPRTRLGRTDLAALLHQPRNMLTRSPMDPQGLSSPRPGKAGMSIP